MRTPRILVFEWDGRLATLLRHADANEGWLIREPRRLESCLKLLRDADPAVLVLRIGRDLVREFSILERVSVLCPEANTVVVGDAADPVLAKLAWDLGAKFVLMPPMPRELLVDVAAQLLHQRPMGMEDSRPTGPAQDRSSQ